MVLPSCPTIIAMISELCKCIWENCITCLGIILSLGAWLIFRWSEKTLAVSLLECESIEEIFLISVTANESGLQWKG